MHAALQCLHDPQPNLKLQSSVCAVVVSCATQDYHFKLTLSPAEVKDTRSVSEWVLRLRRAFLISVIPAEDYNANPWDKSLLITERPSAVAVNQCCLLNYSFSVYSRRQVRDLCDECPGRLGEVVTRERGALETRRGRRGDDSEETANLSDTGAWEGLELFFLLFILFI